MTQEAEAVAMDLNIVSCQTCDALFIESERRQTCPGCGGSPVGPYFQFVLDGAGLHRKDGMAPTAAQPPPAEEVPPAEPAASAEASVEEEVGAEEREEIREPRFAMYVGAYLSGHEEVTEDDLGDKLLALGAEPEAAATAVGRLVAVRDLVRELVEGGVEAQVEVAVEETPAEAPEPEPEPAP